ncbi:MAG: hypothetical protein KY439_11725 [Actinobacteria bacterium]|nr:hypothetical protein [Actinomycetota bacterium]
MPEGDTIHRTAVTLDRWLTGRVVTAARSAAERLPAARLVGQRIVAVEARGKHLLVRFAGGQVLHTHMRMRGSWHVYSVGERWRRPEAQARVVLEAGERLAVCFDAPVVELLAPGGEHRHPALTGLGPDVLRPPIDLGEVRRRAGTRPADLAVGELLLDQQVVAGIGNIWRCETLFACRVDPWLPWGQLAPGDLDRVVTTAAQLMGRSPRPPAQVYRRARRPCPRCSTAIAAAPMGEGGRTLYWCPRCQSLPAG